MTKVPQGMYDKVLGDKIEVAIDKVETARQQAIKEGNKKRAGELFEAGRLLRKYGWNVDHGIRLNPQQQYFIHRLYSL